jgi:hypothetical protein
VQPSAPENPPWWLWPTVLSLDAPIVVVVWQALIAWTAAAPVGTHERLILGSSIWLAYSADRWFEGWRVPPGNIRTARHLFYQRWRWPVAVAWACVLGLDVAGSILWLPLPELQAGLVLLFPVSAYLLSHQLVHRESPWRAPKEFCVALLLAAGAAAFAATAPGAHAGRVVAPSALFALLCLSNCTLISLWERDVDQSHGQTSLATQFGRSMALRALPWVAAGILASSVFWAGRRAGPEAACGAASGVLLGIVDLAEPRIGRRMARVLADAALLTPALPLLSGLLA